MTSRNGFLPGWLLSAAAVLWLSCSPPTGGGGEGAEPSPQRTELLWDTWGVPHIFAADAEGLFFAHGWAQAEAHGDLLLRLFGESRGRAAEYWGETHLDSDRWVHTVGIPERAAVWLEAQEAPFRSYLDAFCRGVNAYAAAHADRIDDEVEVVLPVESRDVLAHFQRSIHFTFVVSRRGVAGVGEEVEERGSNTWAIGPHRTASGRAVLVANPHLPWNDLFTWFESQLSSPQVASYGAALVGWPFHGIAFNDHLGWSHTVNTFDGADLYELSVVGDGYRFDGEVRPFEVAEKRLLIKQGEGGWREETLSVRRSLHGPVVSSGNGRTLALRLVGLDSPHVFRQYWRMARAADREEFEAALADLQMPMFTVMYADTEGHILHLFGGQTPVRPQGDWDFWAGVVDGSSSATLWTEVHPYEDLPRVVDPPSNWLQNANDPPWNTTVPPLRAEDYPPYMAPRFMHFRAQRSAAMLAEDDHFSFEEIVRAKLSSRMELADRILDDLDAAVRAGAGGDLAKRANEVLQHWDRAADAESAGAVLFAAFAGKLLANGAERVFAQPWSSARPRRSPDGLANPRAAVAALEAAARRVESQHGSFAVPWGEVHRLRLDERDLPANGGPGELGIFRVVSYRRDEDGRYRAVGGDSYQAIVEFGEPLRAVALLSYGNWSQPGSPHRGDQLDLFARKEMRPVWRQRNEIEANLEAREILDGYQQP